MKLVGIARLASLSPLIEAKRVVTYQHLPTRNWITRCSSPRMYFDWTINPYRGCEFACKYCYARYTHEFMELREPEDFETRIFAKQFSAAQFRHELAAIPLAEHIAIGTATDPYQPAERRFGLTEKILRVFAGERGRRLSITTKSDLVSRDAELLARIAKSNMLNISFTVTTMDCEVARKIEMRAPRPDLRLGALRELASRGIAVGISCAPIMPGITDGVASLRTVALESKAAGASYLGGGVVFLKQCARQVFMPFLEREFPELVSRYRVLFERADFLRGEYPAMIERRLEAIRAEVGLGCRPVAYQPEEGWEEQMRLF